MHKDIFRAISAFELSRVTVIRPRRVRMARLSSQASFVDRRSGSRRYEETRVDPNEAHLSFDEEWTQSKTYLDNIKRIRRNPITPVDSITGGAQQPLGGIRGNDLPLTLSCLGLKARHGLQDHEGSRQKPFGVHVLCDSGEPRLGRDNSQKTRAGQMRRYCLTARKPVMTRILARRTSIKRSSGFLSDPSLPKNFLMRWIGRLEESREGFRHYFWRRQESQDSKPTSTCSRLASAGKFKTRETYCQWASWTRN